MGRPEGGSKEVQRLRGRHRRAQKQRPSGHQCPRIQNYLRVQIVPAFGEVTLGKITRLSVQSWIDSMAQVLGARTVRDAYRVFSGFMREAVRQA